MASITKRIHKDTITYRVRFRHRGLRPISRTFDEFEEAKTWAIENEKDYLKNPESFITEIEYERAWNARRKHK